MYLFCIICDSSTRKHKNIIPYTKRTQSLNLALEAHSQQQHRIDELIVFLLLSWLLILSHCVLFIYTIEVSNEESKMPKYVAKAALESAGLFLFTLLTFCGSEFGSHKFG